MEFYFPKFVPVVEFFVRKSVGHFELFQCVHSRPLQVDVVLDDTRVEV